MKRLQTFLKALKNLPPWANWLLSLVGVLIVYPMFIYTIDETEQVMITMLGGRAVAMSVGSFIPGEVDSVRLAMVLEWNSKQDEPYKIITRTGLHVKWPWEFVRKYPDQFLEYDAEPRDLMTLEKRHLLVDDYTRWWIWNPILFNKRCQTVNGARNRLDQIVYSNNWQIVASYPFKEIVRSTNDPIMTKETHQWETITKGRVKLLEEATLLSRKDSYGLGMYIGDVRVMRTDLPEVNAVSVYRRMKAERQKIAEQWRSEGEAEKKKITSDANQLAVAIRATAYNLGETIRGEAEGRATMIYAGAYNRDPEFFAFQRGLQALEQSFASNKEVEIYLTTNSEITRLIKGLSKQAGL